MDPPEIERRSETFAITRSGHRKFEKGFGACAGSRYGLPEGGPGWVGWGGVGWVPFANAFAIASRTAWACVQVGTWVRAFAMPDAPPVATVTATAVVATAAIASPLPAADRASHRPIVSPAKGPGPRV